MGEVRIVEKWEDGKNMLHDAIRIQRSFGILVICGDPHVRNRFVYNSLETVANIPCLTSKYYLIERLYQIIQETGMAGISLTTEDACDHRVRHKMVAALRKAGAKEVYGIYLRAEPITKFKEIDASLRTLINKPPTADGLDGFINLSKPPWEPPENPPK